MSCPCFQLRDEVEVFHEAGEAEAQLPAAFDALVQIDGTSSARVIYRCPGCETRFSLTHTVPGGSWDFQRTYYVKTLRRLPPA